MIKKLTRQGNSSALIIDRTLMDLLQIDHETPLKVTVEGRRLIVEPLTEAEREAKFERLLKQTTEQNRELFRKLAE